MLPVFITSNQIPLHVHAVFCQLHVHCIHLARGMMCMRIPSIYIYHILCCSFDLTIDTLEVVAIVDCSRIELLRL